jgi:acyl-coenzyme A synthetase/AMP-(fatty) acid ligase/aryl carrier-like protein
LHEFEIQESDRMAALASCAFDISLLEIVTPWLASACTLLVGRTAILDVDLLMEQLQDATILHTVPSLMRHLLASLAERGQKHFPKIRTLLIGGDAVSPDLLLEMRNMFPASSIRVLYGPTETSIICANQEIDRDMSRNTLMVGQPVSNMRLYVLDRQMLPAPKGAKGELYIGGYGVARGYLDRPALTAEKFIPDPFGKEPGQRLYRTGDLARLRPEGFLEFLGRADEQVKIRGHRIELGEIETVLRQAAGVCEAAVIASSDAAGQKRLIAYITATEAGPPSTSSLRDRLLQQLPEYMAPAQFVFLEQLPLNAHGKVDRRALPAVEMTRELSGESYTSPATALESVLCSIWADMLEIDRAGTRDNFFELGGHSLLAMRMLSQVRKLFGVEVPVRTIFERPTIAAFAAAMACDPLQAAKLERVAEIIQSVSETPEENLEGLLNGHLLPVQGQPE